jgi:uncharacterized protein (DUF885 family)
MSPEDVFELGKKEVARVQKEIEKIKNNLGFEDNDQFLKTLHEPKFFLTEKSAIIKRFGSIDSTVRQHLSKFLGNVTIPAVQPMEWPDAGPATPPGIYLSKVDNSFGVDVFQFNFYGGKYNWRAMEWLYMHEAIPGHHLQSALRRQHPETAQLTEVFLYPGNFEGWGCYVEYFGSDLGLYKDKYSLLGKWEWDLVRSARLVLDAGIHYYGWTHEEALKYWEENVSGQENIAEREVNRVTNWAAQTVSYKAGADFIFKLKEKWLASHPGKSTADFHRTYLNAGPVPLPVVEKNL